jgi:predicted transcriptional regulator
VNIKLKAKDLMSTKIDIAKENTNVVQISARLFADEFDGLPVVNDNDYVIGVVTALDILKAIREGKKLNTMIAKDIMTPNPSVVKKDIPINDIIDIMIKKEIVMVSVVEDDTNKIIGVVARLDVITEKLKEELTP